MIIAGIGCGRAATSEAIVSLIEAALSNFGIAGEKLGAIATETAKADEDGIADAARRPVGSRHPLPGPRSWDGSPIRC